VGRYQYGPFGAVSAIDGAAARLNRVRFSTKMQDLDDQISYFGYRSYDHRVGRWLNRDPIEEDGGFNVTSFVNNDPIQGIDILGLDRCPTMADIMGALPGTITVIFPTRPPPQLAVKGAAWKVPCSRKLIEKARRECSASAEVLNCTLCWDYVVDVKKAGRPLSGPTVPLTPNIGVTPKAQPLIPVTRGGMLKTCCGKPDVDVTVSASSYPASAAHIQVAQSLGHPRVLTINRPSAMANRSDSIGGAPAAPSGSDNDEYPPAMFTEGGIGASVCPCPSADNRGSGAALGNALRNWADGARVGIFVGP
jgi:RHS repeat-associated protein